MNWIGFGRYQALDCNSASHEIFLDPNLLIPSCVELGTKSRASPSSATSSIFNVFSATCFHSVHCELWRRWLGTLPHTYFRHKRKPAGQVAARSGQTKTSKQGMEHVAFARSPFLVPKMRFRPVSPSATCKCIRWYRHRIVGNFTRDFSMTIRYNTVFDDHHDVHLDSAYGMASRSHDHSLAALQKPGC
jgi:hypothetical protein